MYIIEELIKFIKGKKYKAHARTNYTPEDGEGLLENPQDCEHLFLPLDSAGDYYACKYCGLVIPEDKFKKAQ